MSAIQALGFVLSHRDQRSRRQKKQRPHAISGFHSRDEAVVKVKVGSADRRQANLDDGVPWINDFRVGNVFDLNVVFSFPHYSAHKI